jgi:hypothetical protein
MNKVAAGPRTAQGARLRLRAVGTAYLAFAREEPGLFDTAFASGHPDISAAGAPQPDKPFDHLRTALDNLVKAGVVLPRRRPALEYPILAAVHGTATLLRGPLGTLSDREKQKLETQVLDFIGSAIQREAEAAREQ